MSRRRKGNTSFGAVALLVAATACAGREPTTPLSTPLRGASFTIDPTTRVLAYVNVGSTTQVLDANDYSLVATIPSTSGGGGPIAITPDGRLVYRAMGAQVDVIRTRDNVAIGTIALAVPGESSGNDIAVAPDGAHVYVLTSDVLNQAGNSFVSVVRTNDNSVEATIPLAPAPGIINPFHIAVAPDGGRVYVTHSLGLIVIQTSTNQLAQNVFLLATSGIAVAPDGQHVYLTRYPAGGGAVSVVETTGFAVVSSIPVGNIPVDVALSPDGARAYVTNVGDGTVSVVSTAASAQVAVVATGERPFAVAVTPDGSRAFVANAGPTGQAHGSVSVIATNTNTVVATPITDGLVGDIAIGTIPQPTPEQETGDLITDVSGLPGLGAGLENSLLAKLNAVLSAIASGDTATACQALQDFINEVSAQSGKKISSADAAKLIDAANAIRAQLGC